MDQAIVLWQKVRRINPGLLAPGLNLARAEQAEGHVPTALQIVDQVLDLNPDSERGLKLQRALSQAK